MTTVISFPSPVAIFHVGCNIKKGTLSGIQVPGSISLIAFTTPIALHIDDRVWLDVRTGDLHVVERGGIAIWRKDWVN